MKVQHGSLRYLLLETFRLHSQGATGMVLLLVSWYHRKRLEIPFYTRSSKQVWSWSILIAPNVWLVWLFGDSQLVLIGSSWLQSLGRIAVFHTQPTNLIAIQQTLPIAPKPFIHVFDSLPHETCFMFLFIFYIIAMTSWCEFRYHRAISERITSSEIHMENEFVDNLLDDNSFTFVKRKRNMKATTAPTSAS